MITLQSKYGQMTIEVERVNSGFQRVARWSNRAGMDLISRSRIYKDERNALKDVEKYAAMQSRAK